MQWHKDGADATALSRDLDDCRQLARAQAVQEAFPPGASAPRIVGVDAQGRAIVSSIGQVNTDRFLAEHDLANFCMRNRGYELVPVEK